MIREVSVEKVNFTLSRPYAISYMSVDTVENLIVRISTDGPETGFGCAAPMPYVTGETSENCVSVLTGDRFRETVIGSGVAEAHALIQDLKVLFSPNPAAGAAFEMALFDLMGKMMSLPLYRFYTRKKRELPTSITIGIKPVDDALQEAEEYLSRGFKSLKVKLGRELEEDLERMQKIREICGPDIALRVDMNQGYTIDQFRTFLRRTQKADIELIEQPLPVADYNHMELLDEDVRERCAADENLHGADDALRLVRPPRRFGIYNIKLMKCGGITSARRIADIADLMAVKLMWGCNDESRISISAALHTALSCPNTRYLDLDGSLDLEDDIAEGGFVLEDGIMYPTEEPGLGVKIKK